MRTGGLKSRKRLRASQTRCSSIIALLFWRQVSFQAPLSCLFPLSLSLSALGVPWPTTLPRPLTARTSSACGRFVRTPRTPPQPTGLNKELFQCVLAGLVLSLSCVFPSDIIHRAGGAGPVGQAIDNIYSRNRLREYILSMVRPWPDQFWLRRNAHAH